MKRYYVGTELKFALTITSSGFNMNTDPWTAIITNGKNSTSCSRGNNAIIDDNGQWCILVDTAILGPGQYYLIVELDIPDDDFSDGYRHEVFKQERPLCNVTKV